MTDEVQPIRFGGKVFDLNKLSQEQKNTLAGHQNLERSIEFLRSIGILIANIDNVASLASQALAATAVSTAETFPPEITPPDQSGGANSAPANGTTSADAGAAENVTPTAEPAVQDSAGVVPPTEAESELH